MPVAMPLPIHTTCPYCGVGCGVLVTPEGDGHGFTVQGDPDHPANLGRLCSKGAALGETLSLDDRLLHPEINGQRVDWDSALDTVAQRFQQVITEHGPDAVAFYVSGQLLTEDYYVANKLMKGFIGSGNIDTNSRLCMSSAVAAHKRAFGTDTVPACYEDLELADLIVLVGSNAAWAHPVVYQRIVAARKARPGTRVVVIDPRCTATAESADLFLPIAPGADAWLWNGLLEYLKREGALDWAFLEAHVDGFGETLNHIVGLSIPDIARLCGLPEADVAAFYRLFASVPKTVTLFSQGINQSSSGVDKGNAIINCHLATGRVGKPGASPFSITGQPNAMGGREVGGLANQLAAHMDFTPEAIDRVGRFWQAPRMAKGPGLKAVELFQAVRDGRIKALWVMATNPAVSLPQADSVVEALQACPFVVVSDVTARTDTARHAHILLPAAAWGEKDGTVTNSERRISRQRGFMPLPGEARPDWWIVSEVARRMGFAEGFAYASPAAVFAEHAALSGFENAGTRDFDLSSAVMPANPGIQSAEYDAFPPTQWPFTPAGGTPRLFADGRFFTPSGRARMLAISPRPPLHAPDANWPFILNTGRIRDQWHTMTRTGKTPKLLAHLAEPFIDLHPHDARHLGLSEGTMAEVSSPHGTACLRVQITPAQQLGQVFAPIHWSGPFSARGRVDALIAAETDPLSGQPEFKQTPVAIRPYAARWHGFVIRRSDDIPPGTGYWTRIRTQTGWRFELADTAAPDIAALHAALPAGDWMQIQDPAAGRYRGALLDEDRVIALYFIELDAGRLPPRHWLESLFTKDHLSDAERGALLMGRPSAAAPDCGRVVCACFGVGENTLKQAIAEGVVSVEALGIRLKAGSNCGSCIPELRRLLAARATSKDSRPG